MATNSAISWTDHSWNIARGCTKVDADCKYCYMMRDSMNDTRYKSNVVVKTKGVFRLPLTIKEPSKIFTCSLTDFFHEGCDEFRMEAWDIIRQCPQHIFQILTKRPERINECLPEYWEEIVDRVWMGTSVGCGSEKGYKRIIDLHSSKSKVKFISIEPLYGPVDFMYPEYVYGKELRRCCDGNECGCQGRPIDPPLIYGISWVIVGGESGNESGKYRYRPCDIKWMENIISDCKSLAIPVWVKQMGTHLQKQMKLKAKHGTNINEWPEHLQIQQFPK